MSSETYKPHHQRSTTLPDAGTAKETAVSPPRRPATIENAPRDDCTLEVSEKDCKLEFSDRQCNLELSQFIDDKQINKEAEAGVDSQADESGQQFTVDGKGDIESDSVSGTVKRRTSNRRQWMIAGSVLGVIIVLVVIIVPSAIYGTRHAKAQNKLPQEPAP
ncbi:unnamed protein product [Penicillium olsonii]|nr:unnamed protein product [Penicillium olsonii]CAG7934364.1 unnamed protein product [Penicillium olsonii]